MKTVYASVERGIDGGKKVKGRKRHIVADSMGNLFEALCGEACDIIEPTQETA